MIGRRWSSNLVWTVCEYFECNCTLSPAVDSWHCSHSRCWICKIPWCCNLRWSFYIFDCIKRIHCLSFQIYGVRQCGSKQTVVKFFVYQVVPLYSSNCFLVISSGVTQECFCLIYWGLSVIIRIPYTPVGSSITKIYYLNIKAWNKFSIKNYYKFYSSPT